jgi:N-acetylmuramic acid 6-phosphate etherase
VLDAPVSPPSAATRARYRRRAVPGGVRGSAEFRVEDQAKDGAGVDARRHINNLDVVVGITAGGTTPPTLYTGCCEAARQRKGEDSVYGTPRTRRTRSAFWTDNEYSVCWLKFGDSGGFDALKAGTVTKKYGFEYYFHWRHGEAGKVIAIGWLMWRWQTRITNQTLGDARGWLVESRWSGFCSKSGKSIKLLMMHWTNLGEARVRSNFGRVSRGGICDRQ